MEYALKLLSDAADAPEVVPEGFGLTYDAANSRAHMLADGFGRRHTYLRISLVER